jgi:calcineurin-like phosphoesterase family protein
MNFWLISDTHLGHKDFRPAGFELKILSFLLKNVKKNDVLINLGDFVMGNDAYWCESYCKLECIKWLVLGNHDKHSVTWYMDKGFQGVFQTFTLSMYGHTILFSHEPQLDVGEYTLNIHGHLHDFSFQTIKEKDPKVYENLNPKQVLISLEKTNYRGVTLKSVVEKFDKAHV